MPAAPTNPRSSSDSTQLPARACDGLATALGFPPGSFDLRSNAGGIAVSGEITLHHDHVYVQVCQPATGADSGILIRTCRGRRDYAGGHNHYAPLRLLDDLPALATQVRAVMATRTDAARPPVSTADATRAARKTALPEAPRNPTPQRRALAR